ncbi:MAG: hypothetical protein H6585_00010, partial [Flavobacteriales bacterium]|nr:hypothetical protein [Flavobacteriales bacterium]
MKVIVAILESMNPKELNNVRKGLTQFATKRAKKPGPENSTSLKLLELALEHGDNWTDTDYCQAMYGNDRDGRFRSLKHWLTRRLIELQVSDVCLNARNELGGFSKKYLARIRVNRLLNSTYIYFNTEKGNRVLSFLFDQIIREGEHFELFEELAKAYSLMSFTLVLQEDYG